MKTYFLAVMTALAGLSALATDLTWVNWSGDLKASTASNWSPAQTPVAGDNLIIPYDGSGTKYWHNDLSVEYGHVTFAITNTSSTRVDIDKNELRVSNGVSVIGLGGTLYGRTAITGSGDFEIDFGGGAVYLATAPTGDNVYSGNFIIRTGSLNAQAANVLGDEARHGYVYLHAHSTTASKAGKFNNSGTWTMWNDFYYDNTSSYYAFAPSSSIRYEGKMYFRGGDGTIQHSGGGNPINFYGKWIRWAPEGTSKNTSVLQLFARSPGFVFYGGYEDDMAPMTCWSEATLKVKIDCTVEIPYGIKLKGAGEVSFGRDDVAADGFPLTLNDNSVINLLGTRQRFTDITQASGAGTITSSAAGGRMLWSPTKNATLATALTGSLDLVFDAAASVTGTVGSAAFGGALEVTNGTLVVAGGASLPGVLDIVIDKDGTLVVDSASIGSQPAFHIVDGATLEIADGVVLETGKSYRNGVRIEPGDYPYGAGTLRVAEINYSWTGLGGDGDLENSLNWSGDGHPAADDPVTFPSTPAVPLTGTFTASAITLGEGVTLTLAESASLTGGAWTFGAGSSVTSTAPATVTVAAGGAYAALPVGGKLTLAIDAGSGNTVSVSGAVAAEDIRILSGVLALGSDELSASTVIEMAAAGQLAIGAGLTVPCYTCKVGDTYLDPGDATMGAGTLEVYASGAPAEEGWYVWTGGAGSEDKSIFTAANWQDGTAPTLAVGNEKISFPAGGDVEIPANAEARLHTLKVEGELAISGDGTLAVGAGGADLSGTAPITISTPVEFLTAGQTWNVSGAAVNLKFMNALKCHPRVGADGSVVFATDVTTTTKSAGSRSKIYFATDNPDLDCPVVVSNLISDIRAPQAFSATYGLTLYNARYEFTQDAHLFKRNLTVKFPITFYDHFRELVDSTDGNSAAITFDCPVRFLRSANYSSGEAANITVRDSVTFNSTVYAYRGFVFNNVSDRSKKGKGVYLNGQVTVGTDEINNDFRNSGGAIHFKGASNTWPNPLRITGSGLVVCDAPDTLYANSDVIFYASSAGVDLNGCDQTIISLWANWSGDAINTVSSNGRKAILHLTNPMAHKSEFPFKFTNGAGVEFRFANNTTNRFVRAPSLTRGPLIVGSGSATGLLIFDATSSWHGRSDVTIRAAATLQTSAAETFGDATDGYKVRLDIASGGFLNLAGNETVHSLVYGGAICAPGTYGKSGSGAEHTDLACFTGDGILTVLGYPRTGAVLMLR